MKYVYYQLEELKLRATCRYNDSPQDMCPANPGQATVITTTLSCDCFLSNSDTLQVHLCHLSWHRWKLVT